MNYLGVDLGLSGALVLIDSSCNVITKTLMPTIEVKKGKSTKRKYDVSALASWLAEHVVPSQTFVALEDVVAMPGQNPSASISRGFGQGILVGILTARGIPHMIVRPQVWQREIFKNAQSGGDTKTKSIQFAQSTQPNEDWRETPRCKSAYDGYCDAFCIAYYAKKSA